MFLKTLPKQTVPLQRTTVKGFFLIFRMEHFGFYPNHSTTLPQFMYNTTQLSFCLNCYTVGFHPQTKMVVANCIVIRG